VVKALRDEVFEHDGEFFKIPKMSIRPRPISNPETRFYASSVSPESAELIAKMGFGMLVIMQNEWSKAAQDVLKFREIQIDAGHTPVPAIVSSNIACAESRDEAVELAQQYLGAKWDSIENHYKFSDGGLAKVKGYESYGKMAKTYSKMKDPGFRKSANEFYVSIQVVGTPKDCLEQIAELRRLTGLGHLVGEFSFGGMAHERAERNIRTFAQQCLPTLKYDPAFQGVVTPAGAAEVRGEKHEDVFAPA
jgi:alkanesulfonate monooxygenase SsuD/methylene tetrahydromethanopterin reductase-like flavin-dependent oxidoreductase (luciferase family)